MMTASQDEMTGTIAIIDTQIDRAECSLAHMHQFDEQEEEDLESATRAIEEELALLRSSHTIMRSLISRMRAELAEDAGGVSNTSTTISFGSNNSGLQIGTSSGPVSFGRK
jgi:hypothetical protein